MVVSVSPSCSIVKAEEKGGLNLEDLKIDPSDPREFSIWELVYDRVEAGEMPPKKKDQPNAQEKEAALKWLNGQLQESDRKRQERDGRVPLRRLNRTEYEYTMRDLLHLPELEVRAMLPPDGENHGFDNVSSALDLSYVQLGRYLEASGKALDEAMNLAPPAKMETNRYAALEEGRFKTQVEKGKEAVRIGDAVGLLRQPNTAQAQWWYNQFRPPSDGYYRLRAKTFGFLWDKGKAVEADRPHVFSLHAIFGTMNRQLAIFDVPSMSNPEVREATVYLKRGEQIEIFFGSLDDRNKGKTPLDEYVAPGVAVEWLEAEGPLPDPAGYPTAAYRSLFGELPIERWTTESGVQKPERPMIVQGNGKWAKWELDKTEMLYVVDPGKDVEATAKRLLEDFMERAFRRPVPEGEVVRYLALVRPKLAKKFPFQEAMKPGFQGVLCSPDFLFLQEKETLDGYARAARLSYFLWRSMPDERLMEIAKSNPAKLVDEVERMLNDPKVERFVKDFTGQWLGLRRLSETQPDEQLYPEFDSLLLHSMPLETQAFFRAMLERDLSAGHVVDSDFTFVNAPLAELYGLKGVKGVGMREVKLPKDSVRGGLITQASLMKITANGTTTSPVIRGVWILDRLLGKPAPPPPPGTPAIEPDIRGATTVREQLAKHSTDTSCARCHVNIDPPGFALESFDPIGAYRENYRVLGGAKAAKKGVRYGIGPTVDSSGTAPGGESFDSIESFRGILLKDDRQLGRNLMGRLITFGTGAAVSYADRDAVESLLDACSQKKYGVRSMIHALVRHELFSRK
ncbi:DUF1592 domain-containing protein [Akkermansiaceae bacterium]|nr:DUF1592 domain-containing protein [Akkermansiaceae bacterium]